jgi:methionyl-tRNA formyltransferase
MRAVVFGYSNVGDRCLRVLHAGGVQVTLVVTHRDHPGETLWFARVADTAEELGVPMVYAEDLDPAALDARVAAAAPDLIFSFYFRSMLPQSVLARARLGAFNMHGSLLPKFRGRAPTNWAVLKGATETGATLHRMVAKPDAGAIVDQCAVPILPDDTARQVFDKVCVAAETVLWRSLPALLAGSAPELPNDLSQGSYFGGRKPEDGRIDWSRPAAEVYNLIRAVAPPYPGAFTEIAGRRLIVGEARLASAASPASAASHAFRGSAMPGAVSAGSPGLAVHQGRIVGVCGDGGLIDIRCLLESGHPVEPDTLARWLN